MYINEQYKKGESSGLELTENLSFVQLDFDGNLESENQRDENRGSENCKSGEHRAGGRKTESSESGTCEMMSAPLLREHLLEIYINGILTMKVICIGQLLTELVLGRLFTEGIIRGTEDVEGIYICEYGSRARVILKDREEPAGRFQDRERTAADESNEKFGDIGTEGESDRQLPGQETYVETTPSCCTGNRILNDYFVYSDEIAPVAPIAYKLSWIRQLADEFSKDTPLHQETAATHSCYLACGGELLFQCEDIGRHNALDKVIGYALRNGIDLTECMVYTSGRVPTDMAVKVIRAGIPLLVTKAAVSVEAVRLAKEYRLTLIRAAKRGGLRLYAGETPRV